MSRTVSTTWQATEAAPPQLIRIEKRPAFGKRMETIEEEIEGGHSQSSRNPKQAAMGSASKASFPKPNPSMVAGWCYILLGNGSYFQCNLNCFCAIGKQKHKIILKYLTYICRKLAIVETKVHTDIVYVKILWLNN